MWLVELHHAHRLNWNLAAPRPHEAQLIVAEDASRRDAARKAIRIREDVGWG
jgi:hypothetical protein